jgi:hypothetical protein
VPPDLQAALFRAAALVPGMRVFPDSVNVAGRHGTGVGFVTDRSHEELIIVDPATGRFIGTRSVLTRDYKPAPDIHLLPAGTVLGTAVEYGTADTLGQTRR